MDDREDASSADRGYTPHLTAIEGRKSAAGGGSSVGTGARTQGPLLARAAENWSQSDAERYLCGDFQELEVHYDQAEEILWYYMKPLGRPSFTLGLLQDIRRLQDRVQELFADPGSAVGPRVRYMVVASSVADTFNLGGDLRLMAQLIRSQDRKHLEMYARACIDVLYRGAVALELPLVTVSLVQGHALGGGFEAALANNVLIAEETAKFGLPEILFNLFPGMGAYSLLARRVGPVDAERMICSGKVYGAPELHEMGIVDVLAPAGQGEQAVYEFIAQQRRRFNAHLAIYRARQRFHPITHDELKDITSIWVDAALRLSDVDLRKIDRLAHTQSRRKLRSVEID